MATLSRSNPIYFGSVLPQDCPQFVGGPEYTHFKETAAQTYVKGDLLFLDANGTIAICTTSSSQMTSKIAGRAEAAATGVTGTNVFMQVIKPTDIWCCNVMHATPASAVTAQTQLGSLFAMRADTVAGNGTLVWSVDIENSITGANSNKVRVKVVGFPLKNPFDAGSLTRPVIGDVYGLVLVQFVVSASNTDGNPTLSNILQLA